MPIQPPQNPLISQSFHIRTILQKLSEELGTLNGRLGDDISKRTSVLNANPRVQHVWNSINKDLVSLQRYVMNISMLQQQSAVMNGIFVPAVPFPVPEAAAGYFG